MDTDTDAVAEGLAEAHAALARGDWERARDLFQAAVLDGERGEPYEGLGWAAWWLNDEALTISARERAFRLYRAHGDPAAAGRVAAWVAADYREFRGEDVVGRGWLERAHRLLDPLPVASEHGWLALIDADFALNVDRDLDATLALAREAGALGRRLGIADLEAVGLAQEGLALVCRGDVEDGMRRLDEASAIASAEEMHLPISSGWALCCVLSACDGIGDFRRAAQWCDAVRRFTERWGGRQLLGVCRTSYGRILAAHGDWPAAESELLSAVDDLERARPGMAAGGLCRLAELRARQGRTEQARALFERAGAAGQVGLGELALADGDATEAAHAAERVLRRLPATSLLDRLPALELLTRARAALGDLADAERQATEVVDAAAAFGTSYVRGRSALLQAELSAAAGDHDQARRCCEDAIDCFEEAAAPYDAARARVELARALLALGHTERAREAAGVASLVFASLGATRDSAAVDELLRRSALPDGARRHGVLTPRELDVLRLVARGLSDAEIADALVVSPHTVHRHIANVRAKLRLPSRSAAVAYASREGLLEP
ncbi:MAG TPA: LuxR C-terminal-related transcriptional regulator [Solirubrobacteraceae bacterium]|nr:LuxR C-terminal-related transcriptional regulator [Solirubrobacteraceae bacterium]